MSSRSGISETTLDAVHEAINDVYMRLADETFEILVLELRSLLQRVEEVYRTHPAEWLELRRTVAETTLTVAVGKQRPTDECEGLLADICDLGWSDLHRRAQMETMFCGYCARSGQFEPALRHLRPLMESLQAEGERNREGSWTNHLAACQKILERLGER